MTDYAVGDIQGCYSNLRYLLDKVGFDPDHDTLWAVGDLVNRGPESLETLRYLKSLKKHCIAVLGNHDLHLLAVAHGVRRTKHLDTIDTILVAKDRDELLDWLRHRPLIHYDKSLKTLMVHAGIPPIWDLDDTRKRAKELETILQGNQYGEFLENMYGNKPRRWSDKLKGWKRLRMITNYFTRMRLCQADGTLDLDMKVSIKASGNDYAPWFQQPSRLPSELNVIFGHWAALEGKTDMKHIHALDTGCVWGNHLTLMKLTNHQRFNVDCGC
ncbi:MAG: symmetrical bis(5'-nucleosyl)-tetraphosphatase [Endozoicomonadaceae bacterium]|nr:symmetrical bis(5'-nucleosyl)-tetraphosphatase [Endozoicomonadaceae bacterium]